MIFSFLRGLTHPLRKADHKRSRWIMPSLRPAPPPWPAPTPAARH